MPHVLATQAEIKPFETKLRTMCKRTGLNRREMLTFSNNLTFDFLMTFGTFATSTLDKQSQENVRVMQRVFNKLQTLDGQIRDLTPDEILEGIKIARSRK